jgi:hypothetical protein
MRQGPCRRIPACREARVITKRRTGTTSDTFERVTNVSLGALPHRRRSRAPGREADRLLTTATRVTLTAPSCTVPLPLTGLPRLGRARGRWWHSQQELQKPIRCEVITKAPFLP